MSSSSGSARRRGLILSSRHSPSGARCGRAACGPCWARGGPSRHDPAKAKRAATDEGGAPSAAQGVPLAWSTDAALRSPPGIDTGASGGGDCKTCMQDGVFGGGRRRGARDHVRTIISDLLYIHWGSPSSPSTCTVPIGSTPHILLRARSRVEVWYVRHSSVRMRDACVCGFSSIQTKIMWRLGVPECIRLLCRRFTATWRRGSSDRHTPS